MKKVDHFVEKHKLFQKGSKIIVGVSGGPDSVALLYYLWEKREQWNLSLIVAHVDHMFRGEESADDFQYVEELCTTMGLPFEGIHVDVRSYQQEKNLSSQVAARECRFRFFEEVINTYDADYLALAHHGDDQIETMLMRLVRGSAASGLSGIQAKRKIGANVFLIRPFLSISREEIELYCKEKNLVPRIDSSNEKDSYVRNRFRHHVLPFLKKENPKVHERFQYTSEWLMQDDLLLKEIAEEKMKQVISYKDRRTVDISVEKLKEMPYPLQRRGIHLILKYLYNDKDSLITSIHIENVHSFLLRRQPSGQMNLPNGLLVSRSYDKCQFTLNNGDPNDDNKYHYILEVPGEVSNHPFFTIQASMLKSGDIHISHDRFYTKMEEVALPLIIRSRRPGDRMELKGVGGSKKIKDIFIDEKIPLADRKRWPIVTDSSGKILWLPLLKKSPYETLPKGEEENFISLIVTTKFPRQ